MRDSEIDSLSADGAQEPEVALQAPAPSPAAELDLSLHPPDCACPDCTAAYEKGRAAAEGSEPLEGDVPPMGPPGSVVTAHIRRGQTSEGGDDAR